MNSDSTFGQWFRQQLDRREWSQRDFSRKSNLPPSTVSDWSTGKKIPDPASVDVIADTLGLDVDEVLTRAGHRPQIEPLQDDDPRLEMMGLIRRIEFTDDRAQGLRALLRAWVMADAQARQAREENR